MSKKILKFPKNFFWGTATSSHQIEGGLINDWTSWEKCPKRIENLKKQGKNPNNFISGKSANSFEKFDEDLSCIKQINSNAYRFSIEWSRVEPQEGKFSEKGINYYRDIIKKLKENDIEPFITLYHWPVPLWFRDKGSWKKKKNIKYFLRFTEIIVKTFSSDVKFWITINEPLVYSSHAYLTGNWPPNKKGFFTYVKVVKNLALAHKKAFGVIKKINKKAQVGITQHHIYFQGYKNKFWNLVLAKSANWLWESYFLNKIKNAQDFIGINYYKRNLVKHGKFYQNEKKATTDMGWEIYPEGLYHELIDLKKYKKPIYIFENGLADALDTRRKKFILDHLKFTHQAIKDGVLVRGYFHWSLLDNFEWAEGFKPKFGLFKVDRKTFKRIPRPSAKTYAKICKENKIIV